MALASGEATVNLGHCTPLTIEERATRYLACCDPAISGAGGHNTTFRVACALLRGFRLSPTEAFRLLKIYNEKCQPPWSDSELRHKILSAAGANSCKGRGYLLVGDASSAPLTTADTPGLVSPPVPKWPVPELDTIEAIVRDGPEACDVWESSPRRCDDEVSHTEEIVDIVLPADPLLCAGWSAFSFATRRRSAWRGLLSKMPLIVPNPMVAASGLTKDGVASQHSLAATAHRVYQVIEFDFTATDHSGQAMIYAPLLAVWKARGISTLDACAALSIHLAKRLPSWLLFLSSGAKSGHAWFNIRGLPIAEQRTFFAEACRLGADPQLWTRSQFVRMPDGLRSNGQRQAVLYFDPRAAISL
jgi:hypothetical protein